MRTTLIRIGGIFISRSVLFLMAIFFAFACIGTLAAHADTNNLPCSGNASGTPTVLDCVSTPSMRVDVRDVFDEIARIRTESQASSSLPGMDAVPRVPSSTPSVTDILNNLPDIGTLIDMASTSATSTSGLGSQIADSITGSGGTSGNGTSGIGPFVKCELLAGMGWPIPTFSSECPIGTSTPNSTRVILVKNTIGGEGVFGFSIVGAQSGTTTVSTSGNTGSVQFIVRPGSFIVSEDTLGTNWTQTGRVCTSSSTTTGAANGALGWQFSISAGDTVTCTFTNSATSTSTTTPGGGGGCTENCGTGGGGCVDNCGGGGNPGGGVSGGGGGGGGGNGPIVGGGGFSPGEVLGNTISLPDMPGVPNTGAADTERTRMMLLFSGLAMIVGTVRILSMRKQA